MTEFYFAVISLCFLILSIEAWIWAGNQAGHVLQNEGFRLIRPTWRAEHAVYMTGKALFFTYLGSILYMRRFDLAEFTIVVTLFTIMHTKVFIHWFLLPEPSEVIEKRSKDVTPCR